MLMMGIYAHFTMMLSLLAEPPTLTAIARSLHLLLLAEPPRWLLNNGFHSQLSDLPTMTSSKTSDDGHSLIDGCFGSFCFELVLALAASSASLTEFLVTSTAWYACGSLPVSLF
jgi:hypothetical protein